MKRVAAMLIWALALTALAAWAQIQIPRTSPIAIPAPKAATPAPVAAPTSQNASLEGTITTRTRSPDPLPGALVRLIPPTDMKGANPILIRADDKGGFVFTQIVPGHYTLTTACGGYVSDYRQLDLKAGDVVRDVVITLGRNEAATPGAMCQVAP